VTYTISSTPTAVAPAFSPAAGTYSSTQTVTISSTTSGATIYYTTDGSTPTTGSSSISSGGTITVAASETVNAIAVVSGYSNSSDASAAYVIQVAAVTPTFSPSAGIYTSSQTVTISSTTSGATIYYTTDGSTPTTGSSSISSGGTITVAASETVNAIAVASGYNNSALATGAYTIQVAAATPTFSPGAGTYAEPQVVTASSTTPRATIFYTTDGSTPTTDSLSVASGETISVGASETLNAIAVAIGFNNSATATAAYVITSTNAPPSTGLTTWLKADAGVTVGGVTPANGGNVDTWTDQTGTYTVTQSSSGNEPLYITNCINGMPALRFGGNQWLFNSGSMASSEDADMTIITVCSTSVPTIQEYSVWLGTGNEGNTGGCRSTGYIGSAEFFDASYDAVTAASVPPSGVFTAEAISLNSSLNQVTFYRNGVETSSPGISGLEGLNNGVAIGTQVYAGGNDCSWQGDIAEVLIYDHQLSSSEMAQVSTYLSAKYGLLYSVAPTITPAAGSYTSAQTISITAPLSGGVIHYTLDGSVPTVDSPTYTGTFTISSSALVQAAFFLNGQIASAVASAQYYINDTGETGLPVTPTDLTVTSVSGSETNLTWELSGTVNYSAIDVYRSTNGGAYVLVAVLDPTATSYSDQNVVAGDSYTYEVGTVNVFGISDTSASSSVTPPTTTALTITVTTPSGATPLP
jgi:Chitobiase/beta-hexosaminidase C-terminal domain